jgi:hypothetical protein
MRVDDVNRDPNRLVSEKPVSVKSLKLSSRYSLSLITAGGLLCVASVFLPWAFTGNAYGFLPFSPLMNLGLSPLNIEATRYFVALTIILRVATIMIWLGIILHEFTSRRNIFHPVLLASAFLTFTAFGMFINTGQTLSWGAYLSLAGGLLVSLGAITERLEIEMVLETESE